MYQTRNTGTGNGMRGTRKMGGGGRGGGGEGGGGGGGGGMLYSGECRQTFRRILLNILRNVAKHSGECNKHSGECRQTLPRMSKNIPGNVIKNSGERGQTFQGMLLIFGVKGRVVFRILSNIHDGALLRK